MKKKIIVFQDSSWPGDNTHINLDEIHLIQFESVEELPLAYGHNMYSGFLFLVNKLSNDIVEYLIKIRQFKNDQILFIVGLPANRTVFNAVSALKDCYFFERSLYPQDQILYLIEKLERLTADIEKRNSRNIAAEQLLEHSSESIITVNKEGQITSVNAYFLSCFGYQNSQVVGEKLGKFLPVFSNEEVLNFFNSDIDSKAINSTFIDVDNQIRSVKIRMISMANDADELMLFIEDRSQLLSFKRQIENQNRYFKKFRSFIDSTYKYINDDSGKFTDEIKDTFNCSNILRCRVEYQQNKRKVVLKTDHLSKSEANYLGTLNSILETLFKQNTGQILHFADDNTTHQEIVPYAKTLIYIPVFKDSLREVVLISYLNRFEPDQFMEELYYLLMKRITHFYEIPDQHDEINKAEEEQKEATLSENVFATELIDNAALMIAVSDLNNRFIVWNKKAEEVTGFSKDDILGKKNIESLLYPDQAYRDFIQSRFTENLEDGLATSIEVKISTKDGAEKEINWVSNHLEVNGQFYVIFMGTDITGKHHLEKRFVVSRRMELFNNVTGKIAKYYKNLLLTLIQNLHNVKFGSVEESSNTYRKTEALIREAHQFSEQIINLSVNELVKPDILIEPGQVLERSIHLLKSTVPSSINIEANLHAQGKIALSEAQLNQIVLNLALNSVSAMPDGGDLTVTSTVCNMREESFLLANNAVNDHYFKVHFKDTGMGMLPSVTERVFEPFFTTSEDQNKKGLGATLVFNIIKAAHGFVRIESIAGSGTDVVFYVPLASDLESTKSHVNTNPLKILIVDDQKVVRELLKDMANSDGYKTILATDGEEGFKEFEKNHEEIGLAIIDIIMPKMYGNDLYYKLKQIKPNLKVLITSGYVDPKIIKQLLDDGADGFLPKPFDVASARKQIRELLS